MGKRSCGSNATFRRTSHPVFVANWYIICKKSSSTSKHHTQESLAAQVSAQEEQHYTYIQAKSPRRYAPWCRNDCTRSEESNAVCAGRLSPHNLLAMVQGKGRVQGTACCAEGSSEGSTVSAGKAMAGHACHLDSPESEQSRMSHVMSPFLLRYCVPNETALR